MDNPAVIAADYFNFEYKKGLKVCRLTFEVPYEHAKLVRDVLGDPPLPGTQVRVAIARLAKDAAEQSTAPQGASKNYSGLESKASEVDSSSDAYNAPTPLRRAGEDQDKPRIYTRSQIAALNLRYDDFCIWLAQTYPVTWDKHYYPEIGALQASSTDAADHTLKEILGISSKRELDTEGPEADALDKLMTDFKVRDYVR